MVRCLSDTRYRHRDYGHGFARARKELQFVAFPEIVTALVVVYDHTNITCAQACLGQIRR